MLSNLSLVSDFFRGLVFLFDASILKFFLIFILFSYNRMNCRLKIDKPTNMDRWIKYSFLKFNNSVKAEFYQSRLSISLRPIVKIEVLVIFSVWDGIHCVLIFHFFSSKYIKLKSCTYLQLYSIMYFTTSTLKTTCLVLGS